MIKWFYTNVQMLKKKNCKAWKYVYKINKILVNIFFPLMQSFNKKCGINPNSDVIISLTTYPARVKAVWITISSLLNQTYKPAKVVLYLAKEQFPGGRDDLPKNLLRQEDRGLEIVFVDDDLKPHKKYYYALQKYKESKVITADDDVFYPENHVANLVEASKKYPDAVICTRSHDISLDETAENGYAKYNSWEEIIHSSPNLLMMPVGCNGVLYKADFFDYELFDREKIIKYSLYTDDLWLKVMELKNGVKAYNCVEEPLVYFNNIFTMSTGLWKTNTSEIDNKNDVVWEELSKTYRVEEYLC